MEEEHKVPVRKVRKCNPSFCCNVHGAFKLLQTLVNIVCVSLIGVYTEGGYNNKGTVLTSNHLFYYQISVTFLIGTAIIIISSTISKHVSQTLTHSVFEYLYHGTAGFLYLCCSIVLLHRTHDHKHHIRPKFRNGSESMIAAGVLGLFNSALYFGSAALAHMVPQH